MKRCEELGLYVVLIGPWDHQTSGFLKWNDKSESVLRVWSSLSQCFITCMQRIPDIKAIKIIRSIKTIERHSCDLNMKLFELFKKAKVNKATVRFSTPKMLFMS